MDGLAEMLRGLHHNDGDDDHSGGQIPEAYADNLKAAFAAYRQVEEFKVGDLVTQRPAPMATYRLPKPGFPAIVTHLDGKPNAKDARREFNDMTIGVIWRGEFIFMSVESARFTHWTP